MEILLVDDHSLFLDSLQNLLAASGHAVVGSVEDGFAALEAARRLRPDLILMDIAMPRCDGLTATRLIKAELPEIRIVILTSSEKDEHLFEAIKSGAMGYLLKSLRAVQLLEALQGIERGEPPFSPGMAARILGELSRQLSARTTSEPAEAGPLSERQKQVLTLVAQGLTYAKVAGQLHLSEVTVRYHMAEIIKALHLENRAQVIAYAARMGYDRRIPE